MPVELVVPSVGESITEVEIGDWLKKQGEAVDQDEPVVVIETEKVTVELPAPASGTISSMLKKKGEKASVGDVIGYQRGVAQSIERVASGEYDLVFVLPPTQVDDVIRCGRAGARMPQKSTDFYPKLLSGLIMDDKRGTS